MSDYKAATSGGYKPVAQIAVTEATGAGFPFAGISAGRAYTLQVKTGTMKLNFLGADGATLDLGPGIYTDAVDWTVLRGAKVDAASPFTAVLLLQVAL